MNALEGEGAIFDDPAYVAPDDGDLSLLPDPPAIDAGDPEAPCENEPHDADGNCRLDMGHLGNTEHAQTSNPPPEYAGELERAPYRARVSRPAEGRILS